jgi:hypothetical protein
VLSTSGLGTGGGAGVNAQAGNSGYGSVEVVTGSNPSASGNFQLSFGTAPPTLFFSGPEAFGTLAISNNPSTDITVAWTGATLLPNKRYRFNYEWAVSK